MAVLSVPAEAASSGVADHLVAAGDPRHPELRAGDPERSACGLRGGRRSRASSSNTWPTRFRTARRAGSRTPAKRNRVKLDRTGGLEGLS